MSSTALPPDNPGCALEGVICIKIISMNLSCEAIKMLIDVDVHWRHWEPGGVRVSAFTVVINVIKQRTCCTLSISWCIRTFPKQIWNRVYHAHTNVWQLVTICMVHLGICMFEFPLIIWSPCMVLAHLHNQHTPGSPMSLDVRLLFRVSSCYCFDFFWFWNPRAWNGVTNQWNMTWGFEGQDPLILYAFDLKKNV